MEPPTDDADRRHKYKRRQLALEYLVNQDKPFDLGKPFGKYRHGDHSIYIDCQPIHALKARKQASSPLAVPA